MRIAIVLPGFSKDADDWAIPAIQSQTLALAHTHQVTVFSLRYPPAGRYDVGGVEHLATGGGARFGLSSLAIIGKTIQSIVNQHPKKSFEILHAFWADEAGLCAVIAGLWLRVPVVISFGGGELTYLSDIDYGTQGSRFRRLLVKLALRQASILTAGSRYQLQLAAEYGAPAEKLYLLPLGVDLQLFKPLTTPKYSKPTIIQAASLVPVKNQTLLVEVLGKIRSTIPDVCLRMVGNGPLKDRLCQFVAQSGLANYIEWQAVVPHPAMPAQYQQAQIYLQTSRHESQGMAVLEAMACGLPAIGTPVGVLPEVAVRPASADPDTLARQAVDLLSQPDELQILGQQARSRIEAGFDLLQTANNFTTLYLSIMGSASG